MRLIHNLPRSSEEHLFISYPVSSPELPTTIGKVVIPALSAVQVANAPPSNQVVTAALYAATLVPLGSSVAIAQNNPAKIQHVAPDKTEHQMLRKKQQPFPSPVSFSTFRSKGPQHGDRCNGTLQAASPCRNRPVADYAPASRLLSQYAALIMLTRRMSNHPPVLQFLGPREIFSETSRVIFSRSSVSLPGPFLGADLAVKRSLGANTGA